MRVKGINDTSIRNYLIWLLDSFYKPFASRDGVLTFTHSEPTVPAAGSLSTEYGAQKVTCYHRSERVRRAYGQRAELSTT